MIPMDGSGDGSGDGSDDGDAGASAVQPVDQGLYHFYPKLLEYWAKI